MRLSFCLYLLLPTLGHISCMGPQPAADAIKPRVITQKVKYDTDDPAIWYNEAHPEESIIFGTDKDTDGAIYAFDLNGNIIEDKVIRNIKRPNNVDLEYGLMLPEGSTDIIAFTEREREMLRVYAVPSMEPLDGGGFPIFKGEEPAEWRAPMGLSLYKHSDGSISAIVGRKQGPEEGYLWQYALQVDSIYGLELRFLRAFGSFSGLKEIEAIAVDDLADHVYYSDEGAGVHKYHADPAMGSQELVLFGTEGFQEDIEGIAIWPTSLLSGYIVVSDQQRTALRIFDRQSQAFIRSVDYSALETDGIEICTRPLGPKFPNGILVAMSTDKTFHYYPLEALEPLQSAEL